MKVTHLSLANFRNYRVLDIDIPPAVSVFLGDNAQGKSNFLEAFQVLAAGKSPRANNEGELIAWSALSEPMPVSRLAAEIRKAGGVLCLELALRARTPAVAMEDRHEEPARAPLVQKRIRINGAVHRAFDLAGQLNVVSFSVDDINTVGGEPSLRRRFLDLVNCQVDRHYYRQLLRYQRVLWQRNRLLQLIGAKQASYDELTYWDRELVLAGSYLLAGRARLLASLDKPAAEILTELSRDESKMRLIYTSTIGDVTSGNLEDIKREFAAKLGAVRDREVSQGVSLAGPHRDDLRLMCGDIDQGIYGSRGQQRTIALALKLAQARLLSSQTGEHPVLLLDDVLSELDQHRRTCLLEAVINYEQVLITATDRADFAPAFLERAALFGIEQGRISPLS
nr:DNA replication/repair protein RecF [Dehalococcoidia bacterium]